MSTPPQTPAAKVVGYAGGGFWHSGPDCDPDWAFHFTAYNGWSLASRSLRMGLSVCERGCVLPLLVQLPDLGAVPAPDVEVIHVIAGCPFQEVRHLPHFPCQCSTLAQVAPKAVSVAEANGHILSALSLTVPAAAALSSQHVFAVVPEQVAAAQLHAGFLRALQILAPTADRVEYDPTGDTYRSKPINFDSVALLGAHLDLT